MDDFDNTELVVFCESLIHDGELSGDEVYQLAEWLNNNREACFHWPGDILVKPLQEIWSDGKVGKTEIRQIARLLIRIRKEWAKHRGEASQDEARDVAEEILQGFDFARPELPSIPCQLQIKSRSQKGISYTVDLNGPSCTCPDWRGLRQSLPFGSLSRCCKHVIDAYGTIEPSRGWPGWLGAFFECGTPPAPGTKWLTFFLSRRYVLISIGTEEWANVFLSVEGGFERFGFNYLDDRWAYGYPPHGGNRLRAYILACTRK